MREQQPILTHRLPTKSRKTMTISVSPTTKTSRVCARCAKIKQACDGGAPCTRCQRLNLQCHLLSVAGKAYLRAKPRVRRVHTGCKTCKKRKRKCSEEKPSCADCVRLCLTCTWQDPASLTPTTRKGLPQSPLPSDEVLAIPCVASELPRATWDGAPMSIAIYHQDELSSPHSEPGEAPIWEVETSPKAAPGLLPYLHNERDQALLNHYVHITSRTLSRGESGSNSYLQNILPIALSSPVVLHSLLALSAGQWRKSQPQMAIRGLLHQGEATKTLASLLPSIDALTAEVALISCLLLCMSELYDGTTVGWRHHLQGAKRLLLYVDHINSSRSRFFVRLYRFLNSAVTISTCEPPISDREGDSMCLESAEATPNQDDVAIYGVPKPLFHLLDRVNDLAHQRKDRVDPASEAMFRGRASKVIADINNWSLEFGGFMPAITKTTDGTTDAHSAAKAFEWALRLRLHQIVEGYNVSDALVKEALPLILESVQRVRYGSALESCLLFPLVMAGGVCTTYEDKLVVQDRLTVMQKTCGFGQVSNAHELVERVWAERDASKIPGTIVNWARIRYESMGGLAVF